MALEDKLLTVDNKLQDKPHAHGHKQSSGKRILCDGMCVTGPKQGGWTPLGVGFFIGLGIFVNAFILAMEIKQYNYHLWTLSVFSTSLFLSVWTLILQLCVQFSDPGVVSSKEDLNSADGY